MRGPHDRHGRVAPPCRFRPVTPTRRTAVLPSSLAPIDEESPTDVEDHTEEDEKDGDRHYRDADRRRRDVPEPPRGADQVDDPGHDPAHEDGKASPNGPLEHSYPAV